MTMQPYIGVASRYYTGIPGIAPFTFSHAENFKQVPRAFPKKCHMHKPGSWLVRTYDGKYDAFFRDEEGNCHLVVPPTPYDPEELMLEVTRGNLVPLEPLQRRPQ